MTPTMYNILFWAMFLFVVLVVDIISGKIADTIIKKQKLFDEEE